MRRIHLAAFLVPALASALASAQQDPPKTAEPAATLPAAGSPEATALFDKACAKMLAFARGSFTSTEEQDVAVMRGHGMAMGDQSVEVSGGWNGDLVWGTVGEDEFAVNHGRLCAKTARGWKLRGSTLPSGAPSPFVLRPPLLFALLQKLPAAARKVVNVEAAEVAGKPVAILTLALDGETAADVANSGVLPAVSGGPMMRIGAMMGGAGGMPEKQWLVDLALFVDPGNGDVLRLRSKVYEEDPMLANVRIQFGGPGGGGGDSDDDDDDKKGKGDAKAGKGDGTPKVKKGLPDRKPGKTQSVMYAKIDFKNLGLGEQPALDDEAKGWLGLK